MAGGGAIRASGRRPGIADQRRRAHREREALQLVEPQGLPHLALLDRLESRPDVPGDLGRRHARAVRLLPDAPGLDKRGPGVLELPPGVPQALLLLPRLAEALLLLPRLALGLQPREVLAELLPLADHRRDDAADVRDRRLDGGLVGARSPRGACPTP